MLLIRPLASIVGPIGVKLYVFPETKLLIVAVPSDKQVAAVVSTSGAAGVIN
jgi:hypothetical protein